MNNSGSWDFQGILEEALRGRHTNIFTQWFDGALETWMQEYAGKFTTYTVADVVNGLILFTLKPACWFRHELTRLPTEAVDLSSDPGPVYPPVSCPLRAIHVGCGHPEQNGLLWLVVRGIMLSGEKQRSAYFLAPLLNIMRQDAMFGLMVQMGEQISPMDACWKWQQESLTSEVFTRVQELIAILRKL